MFLIMSRHSMGQRSFPFAAAGVRPGLKSWSAFGDRDQDSLSNDLGSRRSQLKPNSRLIVVAWSSCCAS